MTAHFLQSFGWSCFRVVELVVQEVEGDECHNFMKPYILDSGVVQLAGGAATVASEFSDAANPILLSYYSSTTNGSLLVYDNVVSGVSFNINSANPIDTNNVSWAIVHA